MQKRTILIECFKERADHRNIKSRDHNLIRIINQLYQMKITLAATALLAFVVGLASAGDACAPYNDNAATCAQALSGGNINLLGQRLV